VCSAESAATPGICGYPLEDAAARSGPLDALTGKAPPTLPRPLKPSVGRMQIELRPRPSEAGKGADVKLTILNEDRYFHLAGIVVQEPRPGG
jgi:hypothetical protein